MKESCKKSRGGSVRRKGYGAGGLVWLSLSLPICNSPTLARQNPTTQGAESGLPSATRASTGEQLPDLQLPGWITGILVDPSGVAATGATVRLSPTDQSLDQQTLDQQMLSDEDGRFSFSGVAPGSFRLTIALPGFVTQTFDGKLRSGENYVVPQIVLPIAPATT